MFSLVVEGHWKYIITHRVFGKFQAYFYHMFEFLKFDTETLTTLPFLDIYVKIFINLAHNGDDCSRKSAPLRNRNRHRYTAFYNTKNSWTTSSTLVKVDR